MPRQGSGWTAVVGALALLLMLGLAAAALVPAVVCPRCDGRGAMVRDCQLNAGRTPTFTACASCEDRGDVTLLRRLRLHASEP